MPVVIDLVDSDDEDNKTVDIIPTTSGQQLEQQSLQQVAREDEQQEEDDDDDEEEDDEEQPSLKEQFTELWNNFPSATERVEFAYGGPLESSPLDSIHIKGLDDLPLPLQEADVLRIKEIAEKAPFGKGFDTVHDEEVRDAWQIDANLITTPTKPQFFQQTIHEMARRALHDHLQIDAIGMGVKAHLYKMLLYETGGHFLLHRDTEKEPGMFATYLLHIPITTGYEGGILEIKENAHPPNIKQYDFSGDNSKTQFHEVVFYADCEHQLKEVTNGYRLVLAFNLIWEKSFPKQMMIENSKISDMTHFITSFKKLAREWEREGTDEQGMIAFPLSHKYTRTNFSFTALKGSDSLFAQAVMACSDDYEIFLSLRTKHVSGAPEHSYGDYDDDYYGYGRSRRRYRDYDDDEDEDENDQDSDDYYGRSRRDHGDHHAMDTVHDTDYESSWKHYHPRNGDETDCASISLNVEMDVIDIEDGDELFDSDEDPDEEEYEGYTGNAGPSLDYWYHKALLVIFPTKFAEDVEIRSNLSLFVDRLINMIHVRSGGAKVTFLPNQQEVQRLMLKLQPHMRRLVERVTSPVSKRQWYRIMAAAAAIKNDAVFEFFFNRIVTDGVLPIFEQSSAAGSTGSSSSNNIANTGGSHSKEWDCLLYLIKVDSIGWTRVQTFLSNLWSKIALRNRRPFFNFFDLLRQYQFPDDISQYVLVELIAKDILTNEEAKIYWKSSPQVPASTSSYGYGYGGYSYESGGSNAASNYTAVEYMIDAILLVLEHCQDLTNSINDRFTPLIKTLDSYNLLQKLFDKLGEPSSLPIMRRLSLEVLTMLLNLANKRKDYVERNSQIANSWVVPIPPNSGLPVEVVQFLNSEQRHFSREGLFNGIAHARNYANKYFGNHMFGVKYQTGGTGKRAYVQATKTSQPYIKEKTDRIARFLTSIRKAKQYLEQAIINVNVAEPAAKRQKSQPQSVDEGAIDVELFEV